MGKYDEFERIANEKVRELEDENKEMDNKLAMHDAYCKVVDEYTSNTQMHKCNFEELFSEYSRPFDRSAIENKYRENRDIIKDIRLNLLPAIESAKKQG